VSHITGNPASFDFRKAVKARETALHSQRESAILMRDTPAIDVQKSIEGNDDG
jgi:hypothetical protein